MSPTCAAGRTQGGAEADRTRGGLAACQIEGRARPSVQVSRGPDCSGGHRLGVAPLSPGGRLSPHLWTLARAGCLSSPEAALGAEAFRR